MSPAGGMHGSIGSQILVALGNYVYAKNLGAVFNSDTGFILARDPDTVRAPDAAFIAKARIPSTGIPDGYIAVVPDLAVEVISPNDAFAEVSAKAEEYVAAGVKLVWVVEPRAKRAYIFRPGRDVARVDESGALSGEDALPGFELPLKRLFER